MKYARWFILLALAGAALIAAMGALLARMMRVGALDVARDHEPDPYDLDVVEVGDGRITLAPASRRVRNDAAANGVWGIESASLAYNQLGPVIERRGPTVVREFRELQGGLAPGDRVRMDPFALPEDPRAAHALDFDDVTRRVAVGRVPRLVSSRQPRYVGDPRPRQGREPPRSPAHRSPSSTAKACPASPSPTATTSIARRIPMASTATAAPSGRSSRRPPRTHSNTAPHACSSSATAWAAPSP